MLNTHLKRSSTPHCEKCSYIGICQGFCFTESYHKCFNPIIPIKESCDLKKAKYSLIFSYLAKDSSFKTYISNIHNNIFKNYLLLILDHFNGG
jgi:hypothetical protein